MKKLFALLMIASAVGANAAGFMVCGHLYYYQDQAQLINQELTGDGYLRSGTIAYDAENHKLTLNNVDILCDKTIIETYQLEDLEIEVIGDCSLKTKIEGNETMDNQLSCINATAASSKPMAISFTGNGTLKLTSTNIAVFAFNRYSLSLNFNGPDITIKAARGIHSTSLYRIAYKMNAGSLNIRSTATAIDHEFNMDSGVYGTMTFAAGIKILEPYEGYWYCNLNKNHNCSVMGFGGIAKNVKIGSKYDLKVGGVQVTTQNCGDILGDGTVTYDQRNNNTLTLNNATIADSRQVIVSDIPNLRIHLAGTNRLITQRNVYGLDFTECDGLVIEGTGSLVMESAADSVGIGLFTHKTDGPAHAIIRDCSITMPGGEIQNEDNDCALTIMNASIYLRDGYISTPPSLTLENCFIANPVGGYVDEYGTICAHGSKSMFWGLINIMPGSAPKGDVNGDGSVDVSDVNILVNIMLGKDSAADYPNANVDGQDGIDVGDVNAIVNIMLGKQ